LELGKAGIRVAEYLTVITFHDGGSFDKAGGGQQTCIRRFDGFVESPALGFVVEDGD
jgi:hypothetical protein